MPLSQKSIETLIAACSDETFMMHRNSFMRACKQGGASVKQSTSNGQLGVIFQGQVLYLHNTAVDARPGTAARNNIKLFTAMILDANGLKVPAAAVPTQMMA